MKKIISVCLAGLLAAGSVLSGCGGEPSSSGNSSAGSVASGQAREAKISIAWWGSQARHDGTQKALDAYTEKNPNITFETTPSGWDGYFEKLSTQAASGMLPDIVQMDYLYISTYAKNNTLTDLQPFADNGTIDVSAIEENLLNTGKIDGKLSGLPISTSIITVPYNPDVFKEAGLEEPTEDWTWDDFVDICKTVKEKTGKFGFAFNVIDANALNYWVRQSGSPLFSQDGKSLGYEDDEVFAGFARMLKDLADAGTMPNPDEWLQIRSLSKEAWPVPTGDAAMSWEWNNFAVTVEKTNPNIKLALPPYAENGKKALWIKPGMFFSIAENSKNKEEAAKFVNWFVNSEEANDIIMAERGTPVSSKIRDYMKSKLSEKQKEMFDYVDLAIGHSEETPPPDPQGMSEVNKLLVDIMDQVLYGQITPEDAAKNFRSGANEILARNAG